MDGSYLSVVVLGATHDFDEADGIHENLSQQMDIETIHTELDSYTQIIYLLTLECKKGENTDFSYVLFPLSICTRTADLADRACS